jgi:4-hydroxybenzoate polyprenyltransferase
VSAATALGHARRHHSTALVAGLRPHQWTKNLLVFAGLVFSGSLDDPNRAAAAAVAFVAFCLLSSAAYLVNDVRDAPADRLHPTKRFRPVAAGELGSRTAYGMAAALAAAGLSLTGALGLGPLVFASAFGALQLAYTLRLKRFAVADAATIAALFVLRAAAGADAIGVRISGWLLACTALLALFLAFGKRRAELSGAGDEPGAGRAVLRRYSGRWLRRLVWATAGGSCIAYTAYATTGSDSAEMVFTVPFVVFGLGRYLYLAHRSDLGEEPDRVLLTDLPVLLTVVLWALAATTALNMT